MNKPAVNKTRSRNKAAARSAPAPDGVNRRQEWRFDLPISVLVEGEQPQGRKFKETAVLRDISSGGAYFCTDSAVAVGSKVNLIIDLPKTLAGSKAVKLKIKGLTIRLEKTEAKSKAYGVAVQFAKSFKFISGKK